MMLLGSVTPFRSALSVPPSEQAAIPVTDPALDFLAGKAPCFHLALAFLASISSINPIYLLYLFIYLFNNHYHGKNSPELEKKNGTGQGSSTCLQPTLRQCQQGWGVIIVEAFGTNAGVVSPEIVRMTSLRYWNMNSNPLVALFL
jgi:hypothetical protein